MRRRKGIKYLSMRRLDEETQTKAHRPLINQYSITCLVMSSFNAYRNLNTKYADSEGNNILSYYNKLDQLKAITITKTNNVY